MVADSIGFVLLAPIGKGPAPGAGGRRLTMATAFVFMQGFVGVRESLIRPYVIVQDALEA